MTLEGGKEEEKLGVRASEDKGEVRSVTDYLPSLNLAEALLPYLIWP